MAESLGDYFLRQSYRRAPPKFFTQDRPEHEDPAEVEREVREIVSEVLKGGDDMSACPKCRGTGGLGTDRLGDRYCLYCGYREVKG